MNVKFPASGSRRKALGVTWEQGRPPDVVQATEEHYNALQTSPQATMWGGSILEAVDVLPQAL